MKTVYQVLTSAVLLACTQAALAEPAIVYDAGGKNDKSFNQAAATGAEQFKKAGGGNYTEITLSGEAQREQALERLAQRKNNPVITIGFIGESALKKVAPKFPNTQFVIVDSVVDQPNVKSIVFRDNEGSFLVGAVAALKSATGKVGFIGGMDVPLIRRFACGFAQGAKYANPKAEVLQNMTGTTPSAWNDPTKGGELAKSQMDRGVDVIFAAAGGTGVGVYQAAKDAKKFAIGVDSNQNYLFPGTMLTSMVKRVDVAVKNSFTNDGKGKPSGGTQDLGLKEGGVDWALDQYNRSLITPAIEAKVKEIKADIISGKIKVLDYYKDEDKAKCGA
ncbi:BMP family lipoprotein [Amphibiibacter pelophylacis]|uniref:BMP family ABC transporter substrate-binding protein n=1 Tax=Amphibiibacter pelophylacis TaxID=1799477 RepID=A0ACC6NY12_9BURK